MEQTWVSSILAPSFFGAMKPPRAIVSHYLHNPTFPVDKQTSPVHALVSYFLNQASESTQTPYLNSNQKTIPKTSSCFVISSPIHIHGNAHFADSSNQSKSSIKIDFNRNISSPGRKDNEDFTTHLRFSSSKSKPIIKAAFCDPLLPKCTQTRPFSAAPSDLSSKPLDSSEPGSFTSKSTPVVSTVSQPFETSPPIDAGSSMRKPISLWPGMYHSPVTNALWEARSRIFERISNAPSDAPPQSELIAKTPSQSRTSILYKFSSDYTLKEQYRNPWNEVRMGKLLEDLDALAGTISFKHCSSDDSTTRPLLLVTASVDKLVLKKPIRVDTDLKIVGAVTWVGRSSMEIQLEVTQFTQETSTASDSTALMANFTFVARDSKTGKSALINQISPETEQEKLLWEEAEERNKARKRKREKQKKEIESAEIDRLNELLAEGRIFCDMPALADRDSILIRDTCLENSLICQPQQRNIHGRIFGGFLMQKAFELAFTTAYVFAGSAPCFVEVDHIDFLKPVDVGNFLRFKSCVLYTQLDNPDQPLINVEVVAHVTRPELRSSEVSNKFYFTFSIHLDAVRNGLKIRSVVPATEEEAWRVIERMDAESS